MGIATSFREVNLSAFASAALLGESYSASKAVLGMLTDVTMQPLSFQPTVSSEDQTTVQLFFRTAQEVSVGGAVRLEAPPGFDFGLVNCRSFDLAADSHYYSEAGRSTTLRLPQLNCTTIASSHLLSGGMPLTSFNIALIRLKARLHAAQMYGLQISVQASSMDVFDDVVRSGLNYWYLYTQNSAGSLVDGSPSPIPLVGQSLYQLHYRSLPFSEVHFSSLLPVELSGQESVLHVSFRLGGIPLNCLLRLSMPVGFSFDFPGTSFVGEADLLPSATADWPAGASAARMTAESSQLELLADFAKDQE
eukprot:Skav228488  [mRNA]  locus=scaffold1092:198909:200166:- [translate_table: standard]